MEVHDNMFSSKMRERLQDTFEELKTLREDAQSVPVCIPEANENSARFAVPIVALGGANSLPIKVDKPLLSRAFRVAPNPRWTLILYLLGITFAEMLTTFSAPAVGMIAHAVLLSGLFLHGAFTRSRMVQRMLLALALAPLMRIVSLSLPLQDYAQYLWYFLVGAPLFLSTFLVAKYTGVRPAEIGLTCSTWPFQLLIGLNGIGLGYVEYLILRPKPLVTTPIFEQVMLPGIILIVFTGFLEEVIFRGLMQKAFTDGFGRAGGLLFVSTLFAVLHLGYGSLLDILFVFSVALFFGIVALRTRSILGVTLAHGLTNFCLFLVFPFFQF